MCGVQQAGMGGAGRGGAVGKVGEGDTVVSEAWRGQLAVPPRHSTESQHALTTQEALYRATHCQHTAQVAIANTPDHTPQPNSTTNNPPHNAPWSTS